MLRISNCFNPFLADHPRMAEFNKISDFFRKLCTVLYYCGLPNLWANGIRTTLYYNHFQKLITVLICLFIFSEWMTFSTQENLSEKQASDRIVFCISHPILFSYYFNVLYYKKEIVELLQRLCITLKKDYNDPHVEKATIKRNIFYSSAFFSTCAFSLISYGFDGILQAIRSGNTMFQTFTNSFSLISQIRSLLLMSLLSKLQDTEGTFTTVVTAWPEVMDTSVKANILRVISYLVWWAYMIRISAPYITLTCITITLSHQFKNLQSYFYSLNDIFDDSEYLKPNEQKHREKLYEEAIKLGIKLHNETLWCTKQFQLTFSFVFSGQILINVAVLCLLMLQMVSSERTLLNTLAILSTSLAVLISTGFLMWNAGDITVEAALLPTAIFYSGWHRCRGKSTLRIKKMLIIAMIQSQKPVVIRSFGIVELSYQSYLSIVKSSYSAFSLLY